MTAPTATSRETGPDVSDTNETQDRLLQSLDLDRVADFIRRADTHAESWRSVIGGGTAVGYIRATGPDGRVAYGCGVYTGAEMGARAFVGDFACCPGDVTDDYDGDYETADDEMAAARVLVRLVAS